MTLSLVLTAIAAIALLFISEAGYRESTKSLTQLRDAQQVRLELNDLLRSVLDAETGQRGYLLTGDKSYRQPYDKASLDVKNRLERLAQSMAGSEKEEAQLAVISEHVARKMEEIALSVKMRSDGNDDAWRFVVNTDIGREEMDSIRTEVAALTSMRDATMTLEQQQVARALNLSRLGIALVTLAGVLAFYLYLRQSRQLQEVGVRQTLALERERDALERAVQSRTAELRALATYLQEVREDERGHLARELHDELGSLLTAAKLDVARLKSRVADVPDAPQRLAHLTDLLNSGIALKRRIIEDLRPSSLDHLGLVASLEILGREFADQSQIEVDVSVQDVQLNAAMNLTVYRMVQESLTNIGKYAKASKVSISMQDVGTHAVVQVKDDGIGFDPSTPRRASHGLAGMRHRVEEAGGTLRITSTPGRGTSLEAHLPQQIGAPEISSYLASPPL